MANERPKRWTSFLLAAVFESSLVLLAWAIGWAIGQPPWERLSWRPADITLGIATTVPLLLVFAACVRLPWRPMARIREICNEVIRPFFAGCSVLELAALSVTAGLAEELLFRGAIQDGLCGWLGFWPGLLATSVLFGAMHLITVTYGIIVTLVGVYLGWCYAVSDNLLVVIVAHALYDFIALLYVVRGPLLESSPH